MSFGNVSAPASDEPAVTASVPVSARTTDDETDVTSLASSGMDGFEGEEAAVTGAAFADGDADDVDGAVSSGENVLGLEVSNLPDGNEVDDDGSREDVKPIGLGKAATSVNGGREDNGHGCNEEEDGDDACTGGRERPLDIG